jgi:hypothetical protein
MRKFMLMTCAMLLSAASPCWSQSSPPAPAYSAFSAPTVNDFLVACRADQSACIDKVGSAVMNKFEFGGTICLPSLDYGKPVPAWLTSHAETHAMPTEDGIYLALKTLYPCQ